MNKHLARCLGRSMNHAPPSPGHAGRHIGLLLLACLLTLGGCAARKPATPRPIFKNIAVVPVTSPASVYTENRMFAAPILPALIATSVANRAKSRDFDQHMDKARRSLGPDFTQILVDALRAKGLSAYAWDAMPRDPKAPDNIEYSKLPTDDAVLHVWFNDLAMDSPRTSSDYLPRVNVDAYFFPSRAAVDDHQTYFYFRYGADAGGQKPWSIPSDAKYRFPSFDALIERSNDVEASWQEAMREMALRMAEAIASELPRQP